MLRKRKKNTSKALTTPMLPNESKEHSPKIGSETNGKKKENERTNQ